MGLAHPTRASAGTAVLFLPSGNPLADRLHGRIHAKDLEVYAPERVHVGMSKKLPRPDDGPRRAAIERITKQVLQLEHLYTQHVDRLDFVELSRAAIREALEAAYEAGQRDPKAAAD